MGHNFPNGAVGLACLLIRLQAALVVLPFALAQDPVLSWSRALAALAIVSLLSGFLTRIPAMAGMILLLADFVWGAPGIDMAEQGLAMAAAALLGPGAYSIDAVLFGRREIRFRP